MKSKMLDMSYSKHHNLLEDTAHPLSQGSILNITKHAWERFTI